MSLKQSTKHSSKSGKVPTFAGTSSKFHHWKVSIRAAIVKVKHGKDLIQGKVSVTSGDQVKFNDDYENKFRDRAEDDATVQAWMIASLQVGNDAKPAPVKSEDQKTFLKPKKELPDQTDMSTTSADSTKGPGQGQNKDQDTTPRTLHDYLLNKKVERTMKKYKRKLQEQILEANNALYSLIMESVTLSVRQHVEDLPLGHGMAVWEFLEEKYNHHSAARSFASSTA